MNNIASWLSFFSNPLYLALIVAVNSDASTKRLKGDSRPVNPLEQRMIVLGALEAVDWVVSFEEDTPQRLIARIVVLVDIRKLQLQSLHHLI